MKKATNKLLHLVIAAVAVINLVLLFLFQYGLSNATPAVQAAERASEERAAYDAETGFAAQTVDNNASAVIVSGQEESGTETADITSFEDEEPISSEETAADTNTTPVEENASTEAASNTDSAASEASSANNESASAIPVITLSDSIPEIKIGDLDRLAVMLHDSGLLSADDGYGNDISDQITTKYEAVSEDSLQYHVVFSVTSQSGESVSKECTITVSADSHPVLELTSDTVSLSLYEEFDYLAYVQTARDIDGTSLVDLISLTGYVDIETPGTYEIIYSTVSQVNLERIDKTLTVVVEEE